MINTNISEAAQYKMFVCRDSFSTWLSPYISSSVKEATYVWKIELDAAAIEAEKPDIFLYEVLERYIPNLLTISTTYKPPISISNVLNSENMKLCLDVAVKTDDGITVKGWSYIINTDTRNQGKYVRFNFADGTSSDYKAQSYYSNIGDYFKNNKYDYARFSLSVRSEMFTSDIVSMQFIIEDNGQYYISTTIPFPEQGE